MIYLDNAATTATSRIAAETANTVLCSFFANPSALYAQGAKSERCINEARGQIANALFCKPQEIYFTASGSESNNIAILGAARARKNWGKNVVITGFEHPSAQLTADALASEGFEIRVINPDCTGIIDTEKMLAAIDNATALVCCMHINNEIGTITDVKSLAKKIKEKNSRTAVHIDGVQAFCKTEINLNATAIDSYTISGHKINAPKGIGALYLRKGYNIATVLYGGGQERGLRPGTENIAYAAAFAVAASEAMKEYKANREKAAILSEYLWKGLCQIDGVVRNSPKTAVCDIANISVPNIKSETMLHYLEAKDILISAGSACSKGSSSHTLQAMGLNKDIIDSALRISFGKDNTLQEVEKLLAALKTGIKEIAKVKV